jgi:hypothetical protein
MHKVGVKMDQPEAKYNFLTAFRPSAPNLVKALQVLVYLLSKSDC